MCEITFENGYIDAPLHTVQPAPLTHGCRVKIFQCEHAGKTGVVKIINFKLRNNTSVIG